MNYHQSLRFRITFSFVLFGSLLSMAIGIGVYHAIEDIEKEVVEDSLNAELEYFLSSKDKHTGITSQTSAHIVRYYVNEEQKNVVPDLIRDLSPGSHDLEYEDHRYHVLIANDDGGTVYLIRNATAFEQREVAIHVALIASVIAAIIVALWLGNWLAGKVISPVSALADQVARLKPNVATSPRLATQYANDEVGQLASTFDAYLHKIEEYIKREQEFTADVSHELRTPLAVMNGAVELLLDNPDLSENALKQAQRIARAGERMQSMLESLLLLAREMPAGAPAEIETYSVEEAVKEIVEQHQFLVQDKPLRLRCEVMEGFELSGLRSVLNIVLSNLIRNAINNTADGQVTVQVAKHKIVVSDTGVGIESEELPHIFDRHYRGKNSQGSGIGLSIVKRICDRHGWGVEIDSRVGEGTKVSLYF